MQFTTRPLYKQSLVAARPRNRDSFRNRVVPCFDSFNIKNSIAYRGARVWTSLTSALDDNTASNARPFTRLAWGSKSLKFVIYIIMLLIS